MDGERFMGNTHTRVGNRCVIALQMKYEHFSGAIDNYGRLMFQSKFALMRHVCKLVTPRPANYVAPKPATLYRRVYDTWRLELANAIGAEIFLAVGLGAPTADQILKNLSYYETFLTKEDNGK